VGKAVKKILFFLDFVVRYVRFWSRLFAYLNAPLDNASLSHPGEMTLCYLTGQADRSIIILSFLAKMAQNAQKGQKNDQK